MSRTIAHHWHRYNGISIREFCRRANTTPSIVKDLISRGWFDEKGDQPEVCQLSSTRWSLSPAAVARFEFATKIWQLEDARRRTVERWSQGVYIVRSEEGPRRYKIGFATNMERRYASLRGMSPVKLRVVAFIWGARMSTEARLHRVFRRRRLHGEWFEESPALLRLIEKYRFTETL